VFHPDAVGPIQRQLGAEPLKSLADFEWKYCDSLPATWKGVVHLSKGLGNESCLLGAD